MRRRDPLKTAAARVESQEWISHGRFLTFAGSVSASSSTQKGNWTDKKKQENEAAGPDWDEAAKRIQSLLGRFFRQTDIVGRIGENRYAAFLAGTLTERAVWEKASMLSEAFWFASEEIPDGYLRNGQ